MALRNFRQHVPQFERQEEGFDFKTGVNVVQGLANLLFHFYHRYVLRRRLGRYAERDQGQGAKAQGREGIPQDIKAKGFIRERPSTYTTRAGAFKPSNPNTQPQTLISQSNQRPYKSAVTSVTYHTPIRAQAHLDPSGPALGGSRASRWETRLDVPPSVVMLLSHRPKRADVVLFKELLGHLGHKRNMPALGRLLSWKVRGGRVLPAPRHTPAHGVCGKPMDARHACLGYVRMRKWLSVAFVPEMPEEFLEEDDIRAFGSMTQEHYDAWRHIKASFPST
ncbi:hypothetical protein EDB83DRAFT_2317391 [Lactarius deliciosus]|nr:hypothetical protein EDB83DRAFT_2317391 [Lactarius deliciosus]